EAVLKSLESFLTARGIPIQTFTSASSFLSQVSLDAPGCLLLDIHMPGVGGVELQERLAAADSPMSIVFVTGSADVPRAVRVMERGAYTLLEKPYDQAELLSAVHTAVSLSLERWQKKVGEKTVRERLATLSEEERQVLAGMMAGDPNKQI